MDLTWFDNWSTGDVLALAGIIATILVAVIGPIRRSLVQLMKASSLRSGRSERLYAAWFVRQWGVYENPYLDDKEELDLSNTYVSLSLQPPGADQELRTAAAEVLASRDGENLVIEGDPGSGKSTLLKAYGVGALKSQRRPLHPGGRHKDDHVPFFVQLRKLARYLTGTRGLAEYLIDEILVSGAGMEPAEATEFLRRTLITERALVMLDGLDEVTSDSQPAVLETVHAFARDRDPHLPTHHARVVVSCRRQNFIALRDLWVPAVAGTISTLVPLRNSEIFAYLDKLRSKFKAAGGPETFMNALRVSGTLDLHRTPLILAMSVGLYARKDFYEIPNSIAELYRTMIREMLDRQRFKYDPGGAAVVLPVDDKYRFLREFACIRARHNGFDDFMRRDMIDFATVLAPSLREAQDSLKLVSEVADRSGLVNDVSEAGHYVFAHRSLHEYLVAEEMLTLPDGETVLLDRATDSEWRQTILFFAIALEQRRVDAFLPSLAARNVSLAAYCLAGSVPSNSVAEPILDRLLTNDTAHLAALIAATTSPRRPVQEMAVSRLEAQLSGPANLKTAFRGDVEGMLPLLGALAGSNAARIAKLVPEIIASVPDDPRLVEPLWRCLTVPGVEQEPACKAIIERLFSIVMDIDGLEELQRQEPYTREFLKGAVRTRAYPFERGLSRACNLVTLLAWAEYLDVRSRRENRFLAARAAGRLGRVETDRRRTIGFSLFWPARILSFTGAAGSLAALAYVILVDWRLALDPFGWFTPLVSLALGTASFGLAYLLLEKNIPGLSSFQDKYVKAKEPVPEGSVAHIAGIKHNRDWLIIVSLVAPPVIYSVAVPCLAQSLTAYTAARTTCAVGHILVPNLQHVLQRTQILPVPPQ